MWECGVALLHYASQRILSSPLRSSLFAVSSPSIVGKGAFSVTMPRRREKKQSGIYIIYYTYRVWRNPAQIEKFYPFWVARTHDILRVLVKKMWFRQNFMPKMISYGCTYSSQQSNRFEYIGDSAWTPIGYGIFNYIWLIFYGRLVGKSTVRPMDSLRDVRRSFHRK